MAKIIKEITKKDSESILDYLNNEGVSYKKLNLSSVSKQHLLRTRLIKTKEKYILLVNLFIDKLNFEKVSDVIKGEFDVVDTSFLPALPEYFKLECILGTRIKYFCENNEYIYFPTGLKNEVYQISCKDFLLLHKDSLLKEISVELKTDNDNTVNLEYESIKKIIAKELGEIKSLPAMPPIVNELLKLRANPIFNMEQLAKVIELDPSLSAQLMSWACSPYYGFRGKILSIKDAIVKVLGYDLVMNLALSIAVSKIMTLPNTGVLSARNYWMHAVYSAKLSEMLSDIYPKKVYKGLSYLTGLLQNYGHVFLSNIFPDKFKIFSKNLDLNSDIYILDLENYLLGIDHQIVGYFLLRQWNLPDEVTNTIVIHHKDIEKENNHYAKILHVANCLLQGNGVGYESISYNKSDLSKILGVKEEIMNKVFEDFWENVTEVDAFVNMIVH